MPYHGTGAAFGTVEDIMYNLRYGLGTAIVRAFVSVPLHCGTGLLIGLSLADRRFFQQDSERWYVHRSCITTVR